MRLLASMLLAALVVAGALISQTMHRVPDLVGADTDAAVADLAAAGAFNVIALLPDGTVIAEGSSEVLAQSPAPGAIVPKDAGIWLLAAPVSESASQVRVPTVMGLSGSDAVERIESAGLVAADERLTGITGEAIVTSQAPLPGEIVGPGSEIRLVAVRPHELYGLTWAEFEPVHGVFFLYYGYSNMVDSCAACHGVGHCAAEGCHDPWTFDALTAVVGQDPDSATKIELGFAR